MSEIGDKADDSSPSDSSQPPERPASALEPHDPAPVEWEKLIEVTSVADLFGTHRGDPMTRYLRAGDGALAFKGSSAGVSRKSAAARAGQKFRAVTTITVQAEGDEAPAPAHFGAIFLDARDEILLYSPQIPIKALGEEQLVEVEVVAPPRTVSVRLRLVGTWAENKDTSKVTCTYSPATLYRAKA
jgi:hypothetical protein